MSFKKLTSLVLVLLLIISSLSLSFAAPVQVNGQTKQLDIQTVNGRTLISSSALVEYGLKTVVSGNNITVSNQNVKFVFTKNSNAVTVNQAKITLDTVPVIKGNEVYLPLKFVFETLNYTVGYDSKLKQVTLKSNSAVAFPLVIKDGSLTYTFTKPATKIVSLAPSITEILFSIGAGDLVVGRTKYCTFPAEVSSVKSIGTLYEPDLELILDLEPDMVIAATHMNEDVLNTLTKAKINTLTQASPEKISEIYTLIEQLGRLTNRQYEARALVSSLKGKEDRVKAIVANIPVASRKNVYYVVGTGKSEYTAGSKTFIHEIMIHSGLKNVASDVEKWSYTLEQLIDHDPEYLIGATYSLDTMKGSANYASLSALKNNKFIIVDTDVVSIPGPRVIDYSMKLFIKTFYPQWEKSLNY